MAHGKRESEWLVIRRCLAIIRRLQQGPANWRALVEAVLAEDEEAYGYTAGQALYKRLRNDLDRLRNNLYIDIRADRRSGEYTIHTLDTPLLNLPNEDLMTIAWLEQTFNPNSPKYREVRAFLQRLQLYLPAARRAQIEQQRTLLMMDLGQRDEDRIDPQVEMGLVQALTRRQRVEFDYYSPQHEDEQPRRHVVDIFEPAYFDTERGHYYVYGWCHYAVTPTGQDTVEDYITYRLGRIHNLKLLPNKLPASPPIPRQYPVKYWLAPEVARYGVTQRRWITIEQVETQADGVIIAGVTPHPFFAVQELMHYRHNCQVLGGAEMLNRMRNTVQEMARLYKTDG